MVDEPDVLLDDLKLGVAIIFRESKVSEIKGIYGSDLVPVPKQFSDHDGANVTAGSRDSNFRVHDCHPSQS